MEKIEFKPIGVIRTPVRSKNDIPEKHGWSRDVEGYIELFPEYTEALSDLDGFSYIQVLWFFNRSDGYELKVVPKYDEIERGLFSTCSPNRPNGIASTITRLTSVEENIIRIKGIDAFDETPVLDIKPYIPLYQVQDEDVKIGWLTGKIDKNLF
ncbi:MAG: tRNA (N6-threonylcarbamoyladenosine(37)-N6)-methyltransferase TrmO [bacterium]|nr:tRNA (N6-threonylcarbamoyladenosine(37)-N6)-methyltransferase TrmO [bacterium]